MLSPNFITFVTVVGGLSVVLFLYGLTVKATKSLVIPGEVALGFFANGLTLTTIACFLVNIFYAMAAKSLFVDAAASAASSPQSNTVASVTMDGNEVTAFFAFAYAFVMIIGATRRNLLTACNPA